MRDGKMTNQYEQYVSFQEKQERLSKILADASDVSGKLSMTQFGSTLRTLSEKVHDDVFRVLIVGTFKNGKSTFINSLLGEEILPAYSLPATAVINEVKYGKERRAVLHFRDPLPAQLPSELPERVKKHLAECGSGPLPPIEIPFDEIEDYAVIPMGKDPKEMLLESPYEKIELFWPLELLKNGVEIIDSPGLNEHATRTKVTMNYLSKADAIVLVLNATALCSADEMSFIEHDLAGQGFTDPFILVNRFDCISERERPMMRDYAHAKLDEYTTNDIYFVSSLQALEGKKELNAEKYKASGMGPFEAELSRFLTQEKGKAKLTQPCRELKRILNDEALYKVIPMQRNLLSSSIDDVKARYEAAKPALNDLKIRREQLASRMALRIEQSKPELRRMATRSYLDIIDSIPVWLEEFTPASKIGLIPRKAEVNAVITEIGEHLSSKIAEFQQDWQKNALVPVIEERATTIFDIESDLEKFYAELDRVTFELAGQEYARNNTPPLQRIAAMAGGFFFGGVAGAIAGNYGFTKEFAITIGLELGAYFVLGLLGLFNPFTLILVIGATILASLATGRSHQMKVVKDKICENVTAQVSAMSGPSSDEMVNTVIGKFQETADQLVAALDAEIQATEDQIQSILSDLQRGKDRVAARERELSDCEAEIKQLSAGLDDLIFELV